MPNWLGSFFDKAKHTIEYVVTVGRNAGNTAVNEMRVDDNGGAHVKPVNGSGAEIFTSGNPGNVQLPGSSTVYCGQKTDVGTIAAAIGGSQACREVLVQADVNNTVDVYIGNDTTQSICLKPGVALTIPTDNVNKIYCKTNSGTATINWLARS
jgi:hypothetical protein